MYLDPSYLNFELNFFFLNSKFWMGQTKPFDASILIPTSLIGGLNLI